MDIVSIVVVSISSCVAVFTFLVLLTRRGIIQIGVAQHEIDKLLEEIERLQDVEKLLEYEQQQRLFLSEQLVQAQHELNIAKQKISTLESQLNQLERMEQDRFSLVHLLLICGDESFCDEDEIQLNKARIWFRKLEHATKESLENELNRRRQDGTLYKWVHISAHGTESGIQLSDGIVSGEWWNQQLSGVDVVVLANCDSVGVGDFLAGVVNVVVVIYGQRGSGLISTFSFSFWSELARTNNVRKAFSKAVRDVPQLRPYVDLRTH